MESKRQHNSGNGKAWNYCDDRVEDCINRSKFVQKTRKSLMKKRIKSYKKPPK